MSPERNDPFIYLTFNEFLLKTDHVQGSTVGEIALLTPFFINESRASSNFSIFLVPFWTNFTNDLYILGIQRADYIELG